MSLIALLLLALSIVSGQDTPGTCVFGGTPDYLKAAHACGTGCCACPEWNCDRDWRCCDDKCYTPEAAPCSTLAGTANGYSNGSPTPAPTPHPATAPSPGSPLPSPAGSSGDPCFAAESTKACKLLEPSATASTAYDACYKTKGGAAAAAVLMASLMTGDKVLTTTTDGGLAVTRVVVNQHQHADDRSKMLTLTTSDGSSLSLTPDHGLYVNGALVAAADAKVGSTLTRADGATVTVEHIAVAEAARVIMPVTASGTILASDAGAPVLAASHLMIYAPLYKYAAGRALASATLYVVGDETNWKAFGASLLVKLSAPLATAALVAQVLKHRAAGK